MDSWGWSSNSSDVITVSQDFLESIPLGQDLTIRPSTYLVKTENEPEIYFIEYPRNLRQISSEALASYWSHADIVVIPDAFLTSYDQGEIFPHPLTTENMPLGTMFTTVNDDYNMFYRSHDVNHLKPFRPLSRYTWLNVGLRKGSLVLNTSLAMNEKQVANSIQRCELLPERMFSSYLCE